MQSQIAILGRQARCRPVLPETTVLAVLCALDMLTTLVWVRTGMAHETNPLLIGALARSDAAFLSLKGASFLVPIAILELLRPVRPELVLRALRFAVLGYVALYLVGSLAVRFFPVG